MKLKKSILGILLFFSLVPLCVFGIFSIYKTNQKIDTMLKYNLKAISENQIAKIQEFANERKTAMEKIASYALVQDAIRYSLGESDEVISRSYLENMLDEHRSYDYVVSISIIDKNFHVVASSEEYTVGEVSRLSDSDAKFHTGEFVIGNVYERQTDTGLKHVVLAYNGVFQNGRLIGYILAEMDVSYFDTLRMNMDAMSQGTFYLLDGNYKIITAGSTASEKSLQKFETKSEGPSDFHEKWSQIDFEKNPSGELTYKYNHQEYVTYYSNVENTDWAVRISENLTAQKREMKLYTVLLWLILFVVIVGVATVQNYMTYKILNPLLEAVRIFRRIEEDEDYSLRMPIQTKDEIGTLMEGINGLLDYVEADRMKEMRVQSDLKVQAECDPLTGVKNKKSIEKYVQDVVAASAANGAQVMIGFVDIDDFRRFNTVYGHQQADEVICYVAKMLQHHMKGEVGRIGGDEFLFCRFGKISEESVRTDAEKVLEVLKEGLQKEKEQIRIPVTCSIGIVIAQGGQLDYKQLVRTADEVMYEAKNGGKAAVSIRTLTMQGEV